MSESEVAVLPMRRRHVRAVMRIEASVYPRPWSAALFQSELALTDTRAYFVARVQREIVGYAGLMMTLDDGHVTTIAVDPSWQRRHIATRLMIVLCEEALARGAQALTLEVRVSNGGAQDLYRRFAFESVGLRKGYYPPADLGDPNEDAVIMWARGIATPEYRALLDSHIRVLPSPTIVDARAQGHRR